MLPGRDDHGHDSMLERGGWCERKAPLPADGVSVQVFAKMTMMTATKMTTMLMVMMVMIALFR